MNTLIEPKDFFHTTAHRFADYYRTFAQTHAQKPGDLAEWLDNIFIAVRYYDKTGSAAAVIEIADAIGDRLRDQGYWKRSIQLGQLALSAAQRLFHEEVGDPRRGLDLVRFQCALASTYALQGKYAEARPFVESALVISQQINDEAALAMVLQMIGLLTEVAGKDLEAEELYQQSLTRLRQFGHQPSIAMALESLATLAQKQGRYEQALKLYKEKLALDREPGDRAGLMVTVRHIGALAADLGDSDLAQQYGQMALDLAQSLEQTTAIIEALKNSAHLASLREDHRTAYDHYGQALKIARQFNNQSGVAEILRQLAFAAEALGYDVEEILKESLALSREFEDYPGVARSALQLGDLYLARSDYLQARACNTQAITIAEGLDDTALSSLAWQQLGEVAQQQADWSEAERCYQHSLKYPRSSNNQGLLLPLLLFQLGQVLFQQDQYTTARRALEESLELNTELNDAEAISGVLHQLAWVAAEEGRFEEAQRLCRQSIALLQKMDSPNLEVARASLANFERAQSDGKY